MRVFIALGLPPEAVASLASVQAALRSRIGGLPIKWAREGAMHLTLRFLGDVPDGAVGELGGRVSDACRRHAPFDLELGGLGYFPPTGRARVIWVGLGGDLERLGLLRGALVAATEGLGEARDDRAFVPHLTLGRVGDASGDGLVALRAAIDAVRPEAARWRALSVRLMRSILRKEGAEHRVLAEYPLGQGGGEGGRVSS